MCRIAAAFLLLFASGAAADLSNPGFRCTKTCSGTNVCQNTNAVDSNVRVGMDIQSMSGQYYNPTATMQGCSLSTQSGVGLSGKVYTCTGLGWPNAGINMQLPVNNQPEVSFSFWMKPYLIGNNFKFLNVTTRAQGAPATQYQEILVLRENYNLKLAVRQNNGVPMNAPTDISIPWSNDAWMHVLLGIRTLNVNGNVQQYIELFFNGQRVAFVPLMTNQKIQLQAQTFVSIGQKAPGNTAGEAGVHGNSVFSVADFAAFVVPQAKMDEFALNLYHKRNDPAYSSISTNPVWSGFLFHKIDMPKYECAACPCTSGSCSATPTGYTCMCGSSPCQQ